MFNLRNILRDFLAISEQDIISLVSKAPTTYRIYQIPKKGGSGVRTIHHPSKQTKMLQYALMYVYLNKFKVHQTAVAYVSGVKSPILNNAKAHSAYRYSIHIDFKNFFPSIKPNDLKLFLQASGERLSQSDFELLKHILFVYKKGDMHLSIGAPSSPIVSNIIMYKFDEEISKISKSIDDKSSVTRYADDIYFSSNLKGACKNFHDSLNALLSSISYPKLTINSQKTAYLSRKSLRKVTGLVITPNKSISIGREKKRYIKKLIFDYKQNSISKEDLTYLKGYLSYILDVEPNFYNSLILKYSGSTLNSIKEEEL